MNPSEIESSSYYFNTRELARLAVYREAIIARFYTDQCEPFSLPHSHDAVRLLESIRR
jgi:hypothetical protein